MVYLCMRLLLPLLFFACLTTACVAISVQPAPFVTTSQADNGSNAFVVPVYSNGSVQKIPYDQLVAHGYADIPDQISPELAPVIANSSLSGNALNVARIALQDPCIRNLINTGGVVLGVDYYIPFHGEPAPRLILYVPGQPTERRISAFVNESEGHVSSLMVEYRYEALYDRPDFDPFTTEGWAGGYTCTLDECSDVC